MACVWPPTIAAYTVDALDRFVELIAISATSRPLAIEYHLVLPAAAGVPEIDDSRLIVSPAANSTIVVELADVLAPEIVAVMPVAMPFFITVNVREFPTPGATATLTVMPRSSIDTGTICDLFTSPAAPDQVWSATALIEA
jgi:hypothetical protein